MSMIIAVFGVFVLPIFGIKNIEIAKHAFALALIMFAGYPLALAGHYEMFNSKTARSFDKFPFQEKVAIGIIVILAIAYIASVIIIGK